MPTAVFEGVPIPSNTNQFSSVSSASSRGPACVFQSQLFTRRLDHDIRVISFRKATNRVIESISGQIQNLLVRLNAGATAVANIPRTSVSCPTPLVRALSARPFHFKPAPSQASISLRVDTDVLELFKPRSRVINSAYQHRAPLRFAMLGPYLIQADKHGVMLVAFLNPSARRRFRLPYAIRRHARRRRPRFFVHQSKGFRNGPFSHLLPGIVLAHTLDARLIAQGTHPAVLWHVKWASGSEGEALYAGLKLRTFLWVSLAVRWITRSLRLTRSVRRDLKILGGSVTFCCSAINRSRSGDPRGMSYNARVHSTERLTAYFCAASLLQMTNPPSQAVMAMIADWCSGSHFDAPFLGGFQL